MNKKEILSKLKSISGKSITECLKVYNSTNDIENTFRILFRNEISEINNRIKPQKKLKITKALILSKGNIDGALSILIHGYDEYSKEKIKYPEFLNEKLETLKYDDASWHYGGNFPKELPKKNGAIHIGMFLKWCIKNKLFSNELEENAKEEINQIKEQKITGAEFLINICDEKLTSNDLNEIGNQFAKYYYEENTDFGIKYNSYVDDYSELFDKQAEQKGVEYESIYHIEDTNENYEILEPIIDKRFVEWKEYYKNINNFG